MSALLLGGHASALFVAAGTVDSATAIPISTSGAAPGDLILIHCSYYNNSVGFVPSGTGWTVTNLVSPTADVNSVGGSFETAWAWKILTATTDITHTGDYYGLAWAVYRNCASVARITNSIQANGPSSDDVTWPSPAATGVGQVLLAVQNANPTPTLPAGFISRAGGYPNSVNHYQLGDRLANAAAGTVTVTGIATAAYSNLIAYELRSV